MGWLAERGATHEFSRQKQLTFRDFDESSDWQRWREDCLPGGLETFVFIEDRQDVKFIGRTVTPRELSPCEKVLTLYVPVDWFFDGTPPREVWRRIARELWVRAAKKYGWPPPPELPPYTKWISPFA